MSPGMGMGMAGGAFMPPGMGAGAPMGAGMGGAMGPPPARLGCEKLGLRTLVFCCAAIFF